MPKQPAHLDPGRGNDPIPWLPLPAWVETAIVEGVRTAIRLLFFHLFQELAHGKSDLQPPDQ